ncbi:MAG: hypothetical protein QXQ33_03790 [Nitrososphaerota archaeon]
MFDSNRNVLVLTTAILLFFAAVLVVPVVAIEAVSLWTDKEDYEPLEPVRIGGSGFVDDGCLLLEIVWPSDGKTILVVRTDENGGFTVIWNNEKIEGTYTVNAYYCGSDKLVASTTFTDSPGNIQYTLEGLTLSPHVEMTTGNLKGWNEDDWIPFRLTIKGDPGSSVSAAIALEYTKGGKYGIDGFASCFGTSGKPCGSGSTPSSGALWKVLVEGSPVSITSASFTSIAGATYILFNVPGPLIIPSDGTLEITWAVHLARGGSANLICSPGSPLSCTPTTIPSGMGASSYPGASLDVRGGEPPTGDRTVPIQNVGPAVPTGPVLSATKTVDSVAWIRTITYDWSVEKSVSPDSLELELHENDTVHYTVTITRTMTSSEDEVSISGEICVTNTGDTATEGLAIIDKVKHDATILASTSVDVSGNPVLDPGETGCYQYALSFTPVEGVTTYTNEAVVTITNGDGATATQAFNLPQSPTIVEIDESATLVDEQTCPSGLECELLGTIPSTVSGSTVIKFDKRITNEELCLDTVVVENTVTLTEGDSGETHTDDAGVSVTGLCAVLEVSKTINEVVWERRTTYDWTISKESNVTSITVSISQHVPIKYTITATRTIVSIEDLVTIQGEICVKNVGNTATKGLNVTDTVLHDLTVVVGPLEVDTSSNPVLDPGEEECYNYEVIFAPLTIDSNLITDYINRAEATVTNGHGDFDDEEFSMPEEPSLTEVDESAEITDAQVCPENFECTTLGELDWSITVSGNTTIEFEKVIHNLRVCEISDNGEMDYKLSNTVTLIESDTGEERTATAEVEIDVGPCPTRTQGFWATHPDFTKYIWENYVPNDIKSDVCGKEIGDDLGKLLGGFWSDISRLSDGKTRRSLLGQARMQLVQQLLAAILNRYLLESPDLVVLGDKTSIDTMISQANAACKGTDRALILYYVSVLDNYNNSGDNVPLPSDLMVGPADPQSGRKIADKKFWDSFY